MGADRPHIARMTKQNKHRQPKGLPNKEQILEFIQTSDTPAGKREIAKAFGLKGQEKIALKKRLKDMAEEGLIDGKRTAYHRMGGVPKVTVLKIVAIEDGEPVAEPENWSPDTKEKPPRLMVKENKKMAALKRGDRILARNEETERGWRATPIKKLPARTEGLMGVVEKDGSGNYWLAPVDKRVRDSAPIGDVGEATEGELVLAERMGKSARSKVKVVEVIGDPLAPKAFSLIAIAKHGIPHVFPQETMAEAERAVDLPLSSEHREDLRDVPIVAIDPADARDHDDAIWAEPDGKGGYRAIIAAIVAMAFLSFGLWVHHMFTVGIPHLALAFFSAASALVAIPTAVQIFAWIGTLASGRPRWDIPMLYVAGFFVVFVIGGLTGVMLAMVPFNTQAHDSHFVVAHLHYVLVGGFVFPMLAAIYYWLPHISGRQSLYRLSVPAFWLILIGFNLTFFLMHLTGLMGMPRRISTYPSNWGWDWLNLLSSVGGFILTMGFTLVLADMVLQFRFGARFRRDPWRAGTLEWATATPPPSYNFAAIPHIETRADQLLPAHIGPALASGNGYLGFARNGEQETLAVEMMGGAAEQLIVLPRRSFLPLWTALATASFFLALLFKLYWLAPFGALATLVLFLFWPLSLGARTDRGPLDIGRGLAVPPDVEAPNNVTVLANRTALVMNGTLFASLLFGGLFLLVVAPNWQGTSGPTLPLWAGVLAIVASLAAAGLTVVAGRNPGATMRLQVSLLATLLLQILAMALLAVTMLALGDPTGHARLAVPFVTLGYAVLHCGLGAVMAAHALWRQAQGYVSARRRTELALARLWNGYAGGVVILALGLVALLSMSGSAS